MATETVKPNYAFKDGVATANYSDNHVQLQGLNTQVKFKNDGANPIEFSLNRSNDTDEVDGIVKPNEEITLQNIQQGISTIAVRGNGAFRFWAYQ